MKVQLLFIILCLLIGPIHCQLVNVDRENDQDSSEKKIAFSYNVSFASDKQKLNMLDLSNQMELDLFLKKDWILILLGNMDGSFNGKVILENNGYFQFRFRDNDKRKVAPDFFCQYQWNGVLGMRNRALAGCNARFRFWEGKKDDLYSSIGVFYEFEKWNSNTSGYGFNNDSSVEVIRNIPRLNLSSKAAIQFKKGIDFSARTYVQFPMNSQFQYFLKPRWIIDLNLFFKISNHLEMKLSYDHVYDSYRPLPIDKYYYNLNLGVQFTW